ncbi:hypothetical protein B0H16DRAFT_312855 [Mycena metata]|uniref:F-box domain-containing protein n=1 Tax=Mycena metata TaxID=1033252 RepID=A0AAD7JQG4_9AGAR|nr:hypothetical protein B0H16DRAFT_312855 [Mycena metata]
MSIQVPQELVDQIVDYLAHDPSSLKACSLVSRAWVLRTRPHLFRLCSLCLNSENIIAFRDLLASPMDCTFLPHVRSITARRNPLDSVDHCFNEIVPELQRLTGVHALEMITAISPDVDTDEIFRTGFIASFPRVTRLVLDCYFQGDTPQQPLPLIETICLFPALEELDIKDLSYRIATPGATAVPPQSLRNLLIRAPTTLPVLTWLLASDGLRSVDTLRLPQLISWNVPSMREALRQCQSLCQLDIFYRRNVPNLSMHPNLRSLVLRGLYPGFTHADDIIMFLSQLGTPKLERLTLVTQRAVLSRHWDLGPLDAFLASERFPHLASVTFAADPEDEHSQAHPEDEALLSKLLPLLRASSCVLSVGRLSVSLDTFSV